MKTVLKIASSLLILGLISGCFSAPSRTEEKPSLFTCEVKTEDYTDYEVFGLVKDSSFLTYSVDRYKTGEAGMLLTLEIGTYTISGETIQIKTDKNTFTGIYLTDKIIIGEKEYVLDKKPMQ